MKDDYNPVKDLMPFLITDEEWAAAEYQRWIEGAGGAINTEGM